MSTNVSKQKRKELTDKIKVIHKYIAAVKQDENTRNMLICLSDIEKEINARKFSLRDRKCPLCKGRYQAHEEKKTDINIAVTLLADTVADKFDTALILSGDSDLAPVTTKLKELCPGKKIGKGPVRVLIVSQNQSTMNLKQHADFFKKIQDRDLKKSLLPEQIAYNGTVITAPAGWLPKPKPGTTGGATSL